MKSALHLPLWFLKTKLLGQKKPLQTVLFINDLCNLQCKHCNIYNIKNPITKTFEQIREELQYCYDQGSRFVDFEGGEPTLWKEGDRTLNDILDLAKEIGFFSTTVTTNATRPFPNLKADAIWVSLDGIGEYHDMIRGEGVFDKLVKNIETCGHPDLSVNMVVNALNYTSVEDTIEFVKKNPHIKSISINIYTPFEGPKNDRLHLDWDKRIEMLDKVIAMKKKGYPIMNSVSGLKLMKHNKFKKQCWVTNFVMVNGDRLDRCQGYRDGACDYCGFCMAGEMRSVMTFKPDTILAGLKLRMNS